MGSYQAPCCWHSCRLYNCTVLYNGLYCLLYWITYQYCTCGMPCRCPWPVDQDGDGVISDPISLALLQGVLYCTVLHQTAKPAIKTMMVLTQGPEL